MSTRADPATGLADFLDLIDARVRDEIQSRKQTSADADTLAMLMHMNICREPLDQQLAAIEDSTARDIGYNCVWNIVAIAFILGARAGPTVIDESKLLSALQLQASKARAEAARLAAERQAALREAILAVARETRAPKLVYSRPFADSLVDGVKQKLGDVRGTSASSIEREIAAILKDGEDLAPQS